MKSIGLVLTIVMVCLTLATHAKSATIFDNGMGNISSGLFSGYYSYNGFPESGFAVDDFSFGTQTTITDIHWRGYYGPDNNPPTEDLFQIVIFAPDVTSGGPDSSQVLYVTSGSEIVSRFDTGFDYYTSDIYEYSTFIQQPFIAAKDEVYWLMIYNFAYSTDTLWFWSASIGDGNGYTSDDLQNWDQAYSKNAFLLTNDAAPVPEPSTFLLLGGGLAGLAFVVRRRRKE